MEMLPCLSKEAWEGHWKRLREKGILPLKSISDEGCVMAAAREQWQEPWQPDTFHAVSYRLGEFARRLNSAAEKAFEYACQRQSRSQKAKSLKVRQATEQQAQQAEQAFEKAYTHLQDFRFLYHCILQQNDAFLPQFSAVRNRSKAEAEVSLAIECLRSLGIAGLDKALDEVQNILPQLYQFLDGAAQATAELQAQLGEHLVPFLPMPGSKRSILLFAFSWTIQKTSPAQLNLIMFYWNHRTFLRGKRKGKAPMEILSGSPLNKNWLDLLLEQVKA
jgi:hypothetical protein